MTKIRAMVVDDEAMADVTVEILSRGLVVPRMVIGISPRPGEPAGMAAPKLASMLWRARSPAICVLMCSGSRS